MPFFSVIIPTYNRAEFLKEAIESVLCQTLQDFEVIIIDDHSGDDTKEVVTSFRDERIIYILNDRGRGGAGTRNAGIGRARGEWVAFLDDDDVWLPEKLDILYKKVQEVDQSVGLIYTGYAVYDFDKKVERNLFIPQKEGSMYKDLLYNNYIGALSSVAIRRDLLRIVGGFDQEFPGMQDVDLYVRIANISKVAFIKEKLVYMRRSNTDRISLDLQKKLKSSLLFWSKYKKIINKDLRLRQSAASRVFSYAIRQGNMKEALRNLPLTLSGLVLDISNFYAMWRRILSFFYYKIVSAYSRYGILSYKKDIKSSSESKNR
jgi:glycosyltransferase involved in cell wall biosynthesis